MILRDYQPQDFSTLCEIDRTCFPPGIAYSPEDIAIALAERGVIVVIGEKAKEIAGFVLARRVGRGSARAWGHIITIDVLPQFRRSGLGLRLMEDVHRRLKEAGAEKVYLETAVDNTPAITFYEKLGYAKVRLLKHYYLNRIDAHLMVKDL